MSGIELVQRLRAAKVAATVIFLAGVSDIPIAVEAMKLGAIDFLPKPFRVQTLIDLVQVVLHQAPERENAAATVAASRAMLEGLPPREMQVFPGASLADLVKVSVLVGVCDPLADRSAR